MILNLYIYIMFIIIEIISIIIYMSDDFMNIIPKVNYNYLNIDSIDIESNQGISIIHINARSVIKHCDDIIFLLDECKFKFNVIVITETWFQE